MGSYAHIDHSLVCQNAGSLLCFSHLPQCFSPQEQSHNLPEPLKKHHTKTRPRADFPLLTLGCWCDVGDAEVWTGHRRWAHVLPQSRDLGQGEDDFIAMLRLQEADLEGEREKKKKKVWRKMACSEWNRFLCEMLCLDGQKSLNIKPGRHRQARFHLREPSNCNSHF